MARFDISKATLHRWLNDPDLAFPKPIVINRRHYFLETEIVAWERSQGRADEDPVQLVDGRPVVSPVITRYDEFVSAMSARRRALRLTNEELEALSGLNDGYVTKLEHFEKNYGRGVGPETMPLWLGGLRVGIVLVDLPKRPYRPRKMNQLEGKAS
jgi:hypothetical protein